MKAVNETHQILTLSNEYFQEARCASYSKKARINRSLIRFVFSTKTFFIHETSQAKKSSADRFIFLTSNDEDSSAKRSPQHSKVQRSFKVALPHEKSLSHSWKPEKDLKLFNLMR
jgi:hypothetical protein